MIRKTVLIADDHAPTRQAYASLLVDCGYRVLEAVHGGDAITCVRQHRPDLLLLDIALPVLDGIEAAESLRRYMPSTELRILAVTGCDSVIRLERMRAACDDLLLKPCAPELIAARIGSLLAAA